MTANSSCAPEDLFILDESANGSEKIKAKLKQEMLFSIVLHFGDTWFLLCLEQLDADWLNGCSVT